MWFIPHTRSALLLTALLLLFDFPGSIGGSLAAPAQGTELNGRTLNHERGLYSAPFTLQLSNESATDLYFSTNGAAPSMELGRRWAGPLEVNSTTTLRLARFRGGARVGPIETHTYLFPKQVVAQTGAGFPDHWGYTNGQPVLAYYRMTPAIRDHTDQELIDPALRSLPTVSVVMNSEDLFGAGVGIYAHPKESGAEWERAASVELIYPEGRTGFQIDCGIRIQGGWNRRPEESPKHAFRLVFNKRYGQARLVFPLFGSGVGEFETVILRAGCNNTWLHWNAAERSRGDYIRDQWMRDTVREMGHPSARGQFVHLYLNGLYWGLYLLCERPSAPFVAAQNGGKPKQYDVRNGDHVLEGSEAAWKKLFQIADAGVDQAGAYAQVQQLLDVPEFIDYILANLYGANADWDRSSNWYAARRRKPPGKFQFFVWDAERTLEAADANILATDDDESPMRLFQKLRENPDFRHEFAARAQKQLSAGGVLSPAAAAARWQRLAAEIEMAVVAESARWGSYRCDFHPYKTGPFERYTREKHWRPEIDRVRREYFPQRSGELLKQLRAAGLE